MWSHPADLRMRAEQFGHGFIFFRRAVFFMTVRVSIRLLIWFFQGLNRQRVPMRTYTQWSPLRTCWCGGGACRTPCTSFRHAAQTKQ